MYVPVPSQVSVIQWLSIVYELHICCSFIILYINKAVIVEDISKQNRESSANDDTSMKISTKHHHYILF